MGTLYVVATPIGNLEDITLRAKRILLETPIIACEDTRHTGNLINLLKASPFKAEGGRLSKRYISIRDFNESKVVDKIISELQTNDVALVSDAGTPLISDPGFKIVRAARNAGFKVSPIPGPSALTAALSVAGVPTDKFVFRGFLPKKWELDTTLTNVIYESPKRVKNTIAQIKLKYPMAKITIASELTKIHELITNNYEQISDSPKGEWIILASFDQ